MSDEGRLPVDCVGAVVHDRDGRLLLVRRGQEPSRGAWSVPGGRVDPGETDGAAVVREVAEETGLGVELGRRLGVVERDGPGGVRYVIRDYQCTLLPGVDPAGVRAGTDADGAGWFTEKEARALDMVPGLLACLEEWGVLSSSTGR